MGDPHKPQTFNGDLAHLPVALERLTAEPRWVVWRWELVKGRWTKPPYQARYPRQNARANDPETWSAYDDALEAVEHGDADGIGYALLGSDVGAIDLDKCRDPVTGEVAGWAEVVRDGEAYSEITVSGTGTRVLGTATGPRRMRRFNLDGGAGIELFRNAERYITISGNQRGACDGLPLIDDLIDALEARLDEEKGQRRANDTSGGTGLDFNAARQQTAGREYDSIIRNGVPDGERSEAFQSVVWHLAGKGLSADDIVDELARHPNGIGLKYADRLLEEVLRSYGKWREQRRANTAAEEPRSAVWPSIYVVPGELPRVVNEAESALLALGREIYQRGGMIVRPALKPVKTFHDQDTEAWRILEVPKSHLAEALTRASQWFRYNGRKKEWVRIDAPGRVVETYQGRVGDWNLPVLAGIIGAPHLRRDGSLHDAPGYDRVTGLLYKPECEFDSIPERPTRDDAIAAMRLFDDLLAGFLFVTPADKAVALSAILTALDRHNNGRPTAWLLCDRRRDRQVEARRYRVNPGDRQACCRQGAAGHGGRAGEAAQFGAAPRRLDHLHRQLRAPAAKRLPVPDVDAGDRLDPRAGPEQERGCLDHGDRHGDGQQPAGYRRPHPSGAGLQPRCPRRASRTPQVRLGRQ
jgi:hypothetical protein